MKIKMRYYEVISAIYPQSKTSRFCAYRIEVNFPNIWSTLSGLKNNGFIIHDEIGKNPKKHPVRCWKITDYGIYHLKCAEIHITTL